MSTTDIQRLNEAKASPRETGLAVNQLIRKTATALQASNNLSDVANKNTSLDNLNAVGEVLVTSAATTPIGAAASQKVQITGAVTITAFDTAAAGTIRYGRFAGALTLTHNATTLILPGNTSITTAANDRFVALSLGSGNWIVLFYQKANGQALVASALTSITAGSGLSGGVITSTGTIALDINGLTVDSAPSGAADYAPIYDASGAANKKVLLRQMGGLVYLNSGSVSAAAALDIVLTSYTQYRAFAIFLDGVVPSTNVVDLMCRFSTDGGSSYSAAASYSYQGVGSISNSNAYGHGGLTGTGIVMNRGVSQRLSSTAANQWSGTVHLLHPQSTTLYPQINFQGQYTSSDAFGMCINGSGRLLVAQDTDAIRFLMSSGNITANWALYGYA